MGGSVLQDDSGCSGCSDGTYEPTIIDDDDAAMMDTADKKVDSDTTTTSATCLQHPSPVGAGFWFWWFVGL